MSVLSTTVIVVKVMHNPRLTINHTNARTMIVLRLLLLCLIVSATTASLYSGPFGLAETRQVDSANGDLIQQRLSKLWQNKQLEDIKEKLRLGDSNQEAIFRSLFS
uniref:RxLR effector protein n=1 Tax=Steinernema glaseri TaxID=37863 RepID=A0A1I7YU89_9BILA